MTTPVYYNPSDYPPFAVTVDLNIFTIRNGQLSILLVNRREEPYAGSWALPGGFVNARENADDAAWRELYEETNLKPLTPETVQETLDNDMYPIFLVNRGMTNQVMSDLNEKGISVLVAADNIPESTLKNARSRGEAVIFNDIDDVPENWLDIVQEPDMYLEQLKTYSDPYRDPRMRVVSVAYVALAPDLPEPVAGDDAADARWWAIDDLFEEDGPELAFDHEQIIIDALDRVRSKLEYTTLASKFVTEPFTLNDLWRVYTSVWGRKTDLGNFRRKVLSIEDFVRPTNKKSSSSSGPKALLYTRGDAKDIYPPFNRNQMS